MLIDIGFSDSLRIPLINHQADAHSGSSIIEYFKSPVNTFPMLDIFKKMVLKNH